MDSSCLGFVNKLSFLSYSPRLLSVLRVGKWLEGRSSVVLTSVAVGALPSDTIKVESDSVDERTEANR